MAQFIAPKTPKGAATVKTWMGAKGHISGEDIPKMVAQGYSKDYLAKIAGSTTYARFGPNALQALGVSTVYNYDPSQYNKASAPFTAGPSNTIKGVSGKTSYSATRTPYSFSTAAPAPAGGGGGTGTSSYNPTPLMVEGAAMPMPQIPEPEPQKFAPGGVGASIDTNAMGFRRKKSSARLAGLTSKGTSQFKISGQSAKSSGLNIGI